MRVYIVGYWFEAPFAGSRLRWKCWIWSFPWGLSTTCTNFLFFFSICRGKRGSVARVTAHSVMCTCQSSNSWFIFFAVPQRWVSYKLTEQHHLHLSVALANTCWIKQNLQNSFYGICDVTRFENWMKNLDLWKGIFRIYFSGNSNKRSWFLFFSPSSWESGLSQIDT